MQKTPMDRSLDTDIELCAQALSYHGVIIATPNSVSPVGASLSSRLRVSLSSACSSGQGHGAHTCVPSFTVLVLRRPPWVILATKGIPALRNLRESAFAGWFGPIGVGAVFYIQVALRELPDDGSRDHLRNLYTPIVLFLIFASVSVHGITV